MKKIFLILALMLMTASIVSVEAKDGNACIMDVSLISQDPYPVVPGEYVELVFQVTGVSNELCNGAKLEFVEKGPFTVEGDSLKTLSAGTWSKDASSAWVVSFDIRVDEDALNADKEISVKYGQGDWGDERFFEKTFNVSVDDVRTDFDIVLQDFSDGEVSFAMANVGKYDANSVVVRVPEQEGITLTGTDGQMIGNLESGDYTLVSFELTNKAESVLLDVYYTDGIGERRVVQKEIGLGTVDSIQPQAQMGQGQFAQREQEESGSGIWIILGVTILIILVAVLYIKKHKKEDKKKSLDWMKK